MHVKAMFLISSWVMESPAEMIIFTIDLLLIIFVNPKRPFQFPKAVQLTLNDFETVAN